MKASEVFHQAVQRGGSDRKAFVLEACGQDGTLRSEVESLLAAHDRAITIERKPLHAGQRLGPYEIVSLLGRGGMGEVYRARDPRLKRDVALKTIAGAFAHDADRLRRFEQEAHATAQLSHPNIVAVFDVGAADGVTYVVSELVEGETLRNVLDRGALPSRKAIDYATQMAGGLAAAHERGIIHRDLKPENVLVTSDGAVKIVDFGLAKLIGPSSDEEVPTAIAETTPGLIMGTAGYMAPEQARGQNTDHRADIFSLGAVLYEMVSGQRAFDGATPADTISAILTSEPPPLEQPNLDRIVRHCIEKNRERRFQSARDVVYALEALSTAPSEPRQAVQRPRRWWLPAAILSLLGITAAGAYWISSFRAASPARFRALTFRRGNIMSARFSPDGNTVVYGAAWEGKPFEIFAARIDSIESRPLGLTDADVLSISSTGEMAVLLHPTTFLNWSRRGTLARVPLAGGTPREVLDNVVEADWSPDGSALAVLRDIGGRERIEFPTGHVLYSTTGWVSHVRLSPKGDRIAFNDHPIRPDDGGSVRVVDLHGNISILTGHWRALQGLAWVPSGDRLYITAEKGGSAALFSLTLSGRQQLVAEAPSDLYLLDVSRDGRLLVAEQQGRRFLNVRRKDSGENRDLSWFDHTGLRDISSDGQTVLFVEDAAGGGPHYSAYVRNVDGTPAVRLGDGNPGALSPDKKWTSAFDFSDPNASLVILPTGVGELRRITTPGMHYERASWFPDGRRMLVQAVEKGHGSRLYVQDSERGAPRAITEEGASVGYGTVVSADSRFVLGFAADGAMTVFPTDGSSKPFRVPKIDRTVLFAGWTGDAHFFFVFERPGTTLEIRRVEAATGKSERWIQIVPTDVAGWEGRGTVRVTPDGNTIAYTVTRRLAKLCLVELPR